MEGYTLKQLKGFKFEVIKDMFDKAFKSVNTFVDYKTELVEGSEKRVEDSTKRVGTELEQEVAKKKKIDDVTPPNWVAAEYGYPGRVTSMINSTRYIRTTKSHLKLIHWI
ncbi:hypothetical protein Tco_0440635 [Tanacetum coccineum]